MRLTQFLAMIALTSVNSNEALSFEIVDAQHGYFFMDSQYIYKGHCPDLETLDVLTREMCYYDVPKENRSYFYRDAVFKLMDEAYKTDLVSAQQNYENVLKETMDTDARVVALRRKIASTAELISTKENEYKEAVKEVAVVDVQILSVSQIVTNLETLITKLDAEIEKNGDNELVRQREEQAKKSLVIAKDDVVRLTADKTTKESANKKRLQEIEGYKAALLQTQNNLTELTTEYTPPADHPKLGVLLAARRSLNHLQALWQGNGLGKFVRFMEYEGIPLFTQFFLPEEGDLEGELNDAYEVMTRYFVPALTKAKPQQ